MLAESILITGANRGIGLELVRQIVTKHNPIHVFALCRDPGRAAELQILACEYPSIKVIELTDVKDYSSYDKLTKEVESHVGSKGLNLLINNAGVYPGKPSLNDTTPEQMVETFEINTVAPLMLTKAFLPLLECASNANASLPSSCARSAVVNITSQMGSIADNSSGSHYSYRASKVALNIVTKSLSIDCKSLNILFTCVHPGWVQTDMGTSKASMTIEDSARQIIDVISKLGPDKNGAFVNYANKTLPW